MEIRLDSYLSRYGVCSRRKAKQIINAGSVSINGRITNEVIKINPDIDIVEIDGHKINPEHHRKTYIKFNKPLNILSTTSDDRGRKTVIDLVDVEEKVYPVGRLDYNSTGLILLTNDGDLALKLTHPRYHVEKKYIVQTQQKVQNSQIDALENGVKIYNTITSPSKVKKISNNEFEITLKQGMKRQIREMCKAVGLSVVSLKRTHIGNLGLGNLKTGEYRELTKDELKDLFDINQT